MRTDLSALHTMLNTIREQIYLVQIAIKEQEEELHDIAERQDGHAKILRSIWKHVKDTPPSSSKPSTSTPSWGSVIAGAQYAAAAILLAFMLMGGDLTRAEKAVAVLKGLGPPL